MEYRIEAKHPAVVHSVRKSGHHQVNGVKFEEREGRAISEPVPDATIKTFMGVTGYLLVRAEPPYEVVSDLSGEKRRGATPAGEAKEGATETAPPEGDATETAAEPAAEAAPAEAAPAEAPKAAAKKPRPKKAAAKKATSNNK